MTPEQLKASILQYAIQGKLVEQKNEDGTAEILYQKIQEEKQELISKGKIKKEKQLPEITEDEIPFDIPESWKWVRLPEIGTSSLGKTLNKGTDAGEEVSYLCSINVYWEGISLDKVKKAKFSETDMEKYLLQKGDLLVCEGGEVGRCAVWDDDMEMYYQNALHCVRFYGALNPYYFKYCFELYKYNRILENASKGMTIKHLVQGALYSIPFPMPPIDEQNRIVEKISEFLHIVDRYAIAYEKLEKFNTKFPKDMQNSILQYAIQGKLVEQIAGEGTGEELYQQIVANRESLIKENVIKRDKRTESIVNLNEVPFEIPENWKWVTLGSILNKLTDGTHKTPKYTASGVKFVSVKDMSNGYLSLDNTKFISEEEHKELYARCNPEKGDIILSKVGTTGVPAIVDTDEEFSLFVSVALLKFDHNCLDKKFLYYMLMSPLVQAQAKENTRGVGNKNWVLDAIGNTMVVLPPLKEQIRIVDKLEELLPYCDRLVK